MKNTSLYTSNTLNIIQEIASLLDPDFQERNDWISLSCPFAKVRHKKGTDIHPSFGISLKYPFAYNCFSCSVKGRLTVLPRALDQLNIPYDSRLVSLINQLYFYSPIDFTEYNEQDDRPVLSDKYIPNEWLKQFSKIKQWGKINKQTLDAFNIRYDKANNIVILPIMDFSGIIRAVYKYYVKTKRKIVWKELTGEGLKKQGLFYGMHLVDTSKPIYLVEGLRDVLLCYQKGLNVMGLLGVNITNAQLYILKTLNTEYYLFLDNDTAGKQATLKLEKYLKNTKRIIYFGAKDPAELIEKGLFNKFILDKS